MARRNVRGQKSRREFRVIARGVRKSRRDIERLQHASLDYFNAELERQAQEEQSRQAEPPTDLALHDSQATGDDDANR